MEPDPQPLPKKRIRWGLLVFLALVGLVLLGGVLVLAGLGSLMKGKAIAVKPDSTLVITLDRPLQEPQPDPIMTELFHARIYSVYDVVSALDRAATDDRIKSVLLDVGSFPSGFGKMQELRDAVARFKTSKKPVWAYFEFASNGGYYLCSAADKVYAPPSGNLLLNGLAEQQESWYRNARFWGRFFARIPNDLAALVGRRFIIASESNDGTRSAL